VDARPNASWAAGVALLGVFALALGVRALGFEWVFVGDEVYFAPADPQYHVRRALYSFVNFPRVLLFDPYINHPGGASVPWPPLYDFLVGGAAWLTTDTLVGFERIAAWSGPILGALTVVPLYRIGIGLGVPGVGLLAGVVFALLPISVNYTRVGNADHHSLVALIGAWLLYACVALADPGASRARLVRLAVGYAALRLALLLTWHGSLLYLALAEASLLLTFAFSGRRFLLAAQCWGSAAVVACLVPLLLVSPTPLLGDYSSIALSWLHVLALGAVAFVSGGLWWIEWRGSAGSPLSRLVVMAVLSGAYAGVVLLLPGPRAGLVPAYQFLTMTDHVGAVTGEQSPIFAVFGRSPGAPAVLSWGYLAYLIPLAPLAGLVHALRADAEPRIRGALWVLAGWGGFFGLLAILQRRYGNDFGPAGALLFALGAWSLARWAISRLSPSSLIPSHRDVAAHALAAALLIALLAPPIARVYAPRAGSTWAALTRSDWPGDAAERSIAATLNRFAREIARVTPATSGYLEGGSSPEYGVIAHANIGHALQYGARRATATDPFWAYIGPENWERSFAFLAARDEDRALELAEALNGRYVVTQPDAEPGTVVARLHHGNGSQVGAAPALEHFRLVTEAPEGGRSIGEIFHPQPTGSIPYRLFEIVPGARLEVGAAPGSDVVATVSLLTPSGRERIYRNAARVGEDGWARLVLPYTTDATTLTRARGPYRVRVAGVDHALRVSEAQVQGAQRIVLVAGGGDESASDSSDGSR
jgi:dolichyl-diphosphooligosaccharide--protein glycosyltransferase